MIHLNKDSFNRNLNTSIYIELFYPSQLFGAKSMWTADILMIYIDE